VMTLQRLDWALGSGGGRSVRLRCPVALRRRGRRVRRRWLVPVCPHGAVDVRERLRRSKRPDRIFEVGLEAARAAGLVNRRRVLDSTPLYDAVATMDTVTLIRSAVRGLLTAADAELEAELRAVLSRGGTKCGYPATGGPHACESCGPCGGGPDTRPRPRRAGRCAAGGRVRRWGEVAPFSCRSRSTRTASLVILHTYAGTGATSGMPTDCPLVRSNFAA
jgi:hypothetical protein